jgi:hypothetical protein
LFSSPPWWRPPGTKEGPLLQEPKSLWSCSLLWLQQ